MKKVILVFAVLLSACGFTPMYSDNSGDSKTLEYSVNILPIPGTDGVELRNKLRSNLNPFGEAKNPDYNLQVSLSTGGRLKGIQRTGDATWQEIIVSANYSLTDAATGKELLKNSDAVSESYTFVENLVAANSASAAATASAIRILSDKISARVKLFINMQGAENETERKSTP